MKRILVSTLFASAVALVVASSAGADAPPLKIGMVSTLSGNFAQAPQTDEAATDRVL